MTAPETQGAPCLSCDGCGWDETDDNVCSECDGTGWSE